MAGSRSPLPLGIDAGAPEIDLFRLIDDGTLPRVATPEPGPVGATKTTAANAPSEATPANDPDIEKLNLAATARTAAYALKKAHPSIQFTSGRRNKEEQAAAMASNVVKNPKRKWIEETYKPSPLRTRCQEWVDEHPEKTTQAEIAAGLTTVFNAATDSELGRLSKHLSGEAFDVQPVEKDAEAIKKTIKNLPGLGLFLDKEGGLVRWHVQF
jgi:hypothetical protein